MRYVGAIHESPVFADGSLLSEYGKFAEKTIGELPLQGRSELSKIVGYFKMNVSKHIPSSGYDKEIWQRSFYDHIIRNEEDYFHHLQYINENPKKWENDEYF